MEYNNVVILSLIIFCLNFFQTRENPNPTPRGGGGQQDTCLSYKFVKPTATHPLHIP
jgi:hypothetical protein